MESQNFIPGLLGEERENVYPHKRSFRHSETHEIDFSPDAVAEFSSISYPITQHYEKEIAMISPFVCSLACLCMSPPTGTHKGSVQRFFFVVAVVAARGRGARPRRRPRRRHRRRALLSVFSDQRLVTIAQ